MILALGPIRGGREVSILLDHFAQIFDKKITKKGLRLEEWEGKILLDFLGTSGEKITIPTGGEIIPNLFASKDSELYRQRLERIDVPAELNTMDACSGLLAVPRDDAWHIYTIAAGLPQEEIVIHGDLVQGLHKQKLNIKIYKKIKKGIHAYRQSKKSAFNYG